MMLTVLIDGVRRSNTMDVDGVVMLLT
jgi:hypothetical protein